jgi:hypothetical protein
MLKVKQKYYREVKFSSVKRFEFDEVVRIRGSRKWFKISTESPSVAGLRLSTCDVRHWDSTNRDDSYDIVVFYGSL